jgi:hypothetical protein
MGLQWPVFRDAAFGARIQTLRGNTMKKQKNKSSFSGLAVKVLLEQYACPIPYHQVRARFMGNIATPDMTVSSVQEIQRIWDNELPTFDSKSEAEEFFSVLMQGLWNGLSAHPYYTTVGWFRGPGHDLQTDSYR